ncbi:MAG: carbohydrate kinase [Clostridia bacterium]|nr:carbohydrate kinase [Clostridia bacterium]
MRITTIGEILIDMTQTGTDANGNAIFAAIPGGAPANLAVAARKLGVETAFIGCVGNDPFGAILRKTLLRYGVDASGLQVSGDASTTLAIVTVDENGERSFAFCRKPGADTQIDRAKALEAASHAEILHFGSVSLAADACRDTIVSAVKRAKENGALITYDPNYRASLWTSEDAAVAIMRSVLPLCDIVKISEEETLLLSGYGAPEKAAEALIGQGVKLVIVTLGADGAYWRYGEDSGTVPGFKVKVADTNGAGDTFFGAFVSRIAKHGGLNGLTPERITRYVRYANRAASITASRPGAIPAMPTEDELTEE